MQTEAAMDVGGGGGGGEAVDEVLDDSIDLVARANSVRVEPGAFLPIIHSTPCAIHNRGDVPERRLDLLYTTSCHGGKVGVEVKGRGKLTPRSLMDSQAMTFTNHTPRLSKEGLRDGAGHGSRPRYRKPARLPNEGLTSKDVVMTWLKHGSAPQGESHFPDITQSSSKVSQNHVTTRRRHNHSAVSE